MVPNRFIEMATQSTLPYTKSFGIIRTLRGNLVFSLLCINDVLVVHFEIHKFCSNELKIFVISKHIMNKIINQGEI
jgi:hypothetical protein